MVSLRRGRRRKVLVVHTHPTPISFSAELRRTVVGALTDAGHDVDLLDLYAEGFDPVLPLSEHKTRFDPATADAVVADHVRRLRWADTLVFVHPTWWGGMPAMLKGWFDRVWALGAAYEMVEGRNRIRGSLRHVDRLVVVTTHGSSKWVNSLQGEPGKRQMLRQFRVLLGRRCRTRWVALYTIDRSTETERQAFLDRVIHVMQRV